MTEKRFEIVKSAIIDGARVIKDNEKKYTFATTFETATLINYRKALNELNDENEQLKSRIQYLERKIERERNSHIKQHEKWENEIQKENEQLKKEIAHLKNRLAYKDQQSNEKFKGIEDWGRGGF